MQENVLPFPRRAPRRQVVGPNAVIGTLIFVVTELMLFAGFMSAFTITRATVCGDMNASASCVERTMRSKV